MPLDNWIAQFFIPINIAVLAFSYVFSFQFYKNLLGELDDLLSIYGDRVKEVQGESNYLKIQSCYWNGGTVMNVVFIWCGISIFLGLIIIKLSSSSSQKFVDFEISWIYWLPLCVFSMAYLIYDRLTEYVDDTFFLLCISPALILFIFITVTSPNSVLDSTLLMLVGLFYYFVIWFISIILYRPLRKLEELREELREKYPRNT